MGWMGAEVCCRERKLAVALHGHLATPAEQLLPRRFPFLLGTE